jgi:hypothetical protein
MGATSQIQGVREKGSKACILSFEMGLQRFWRQSGFCPSDVGGCARPNPVSAKKNGCIGVVQCALNAHCATRAHSGHHPWISSSRNWKNLQ